ncbi:hypothetical protein C366_02608 [Cryptococcus neoformans Tu401-1]|nr:hypothetical protein C366_02608 [Cryptococcus neoformans var. grubii Tu401-1]
MFEKDAKNRRKSKTQIRKHGKRKRKPTHSCLILSSFPFFDLLQIQQLLRLWSPWPPFSCKLFNAGIMSLEIHFRYECFEGREGKRVWGGEGVDEEEWPLDCARASDQMKMVETGRTK